MMEKCGKGSQGTLNLEVMRKNKKNKSFAHLVRHVIVSHILAPFAAV